MLGEVEQVRGARQVEVAIGVELASEPVCMILEIAFDGKIAEVHVARAVVRYEVRPDGIRVLPTDVWLLRTPLRPGATWPAPGGRVAELVSTNAVAETPAGRFDRCVEVRELGGKLELEVRTVYCPGVGPVSVTSTMQSNVSERALSVSARLRGYSVTPRGSDR